MVGFVVILAVLGFAIVWGVHQYWKQGDHPLPILEAVCAAGWVLALLLAALVVMPSFTANVITENVDGRTIYRVDKTAVQYTLILSPLIVGGVWQTSRLRDRPGRVGLTILRYLCVSLAVGVAVLLWGMVTGASGAASVHTYVQGALTVLPFVLVLVLLSVTHAALGAVVLGADLSVVAHALWVGGGGHLVGWQDFLGILPGQLPVWLEWACAVISVGASAWGLWSSNIVGAVGEFDV